MLWGLSFKKYVFFRPGDIINFKVLRKDGKFRKDSKFCKGDKFIYNFKLYSTYNVLIS